MNARWFSTLLCHALGLILSIAFVLPANSCSPAAEPNFLPIRRGEFWLKRSWNPKDVRIIVGWRWYLKELEQPHQYPLTAKIGPRGDALVLVPPLDIKPGEYWLGVVRPNNCDPKRIELCNHRWRGHPDRLWQMTILPEPLPKNSATLPSKWEFVELSTQMGEWNVGSNIIVSPARRSQSSGSQLYYELWRGNTLEKSWFQSSTPYTGDPARLMLGYEGCQWGLPLRYQTDYRLKLFTIERDASIAKVADWQFHTPQLPGVTEEEIHDFYRWQDLNLAYSKLPPSSKKREALELELAPFRDRISSLSTRMNAGMKALSGKSFRLSELQSGHH